MKQLCIGLAGWGLAAGSLAQTAPLPTNPLQPPGLVPETVLAWDAATKEVNVNAGEGNAFFTFWVTNVCSSNVSILSVQTSCGCTAAQLPSLPWGLSPGSNGPIKVTLDVRGRYGAVMKGVTIHTTAGLKALMVRANVPQPATLVGHPFQVPSPASPPVPAKLSERTRNLQAALADRQAVFKGDCARCHVAPGRGKSGRDLYAAVCAICHEAAPRAAMVPDLRQPKTPRPAEFWRVLVAQGRPGTLMPAFAAGQGGPLTEEQVVSLAEYLDKDLPKTPAVVTKPVVAPPRVVAQPARIHPSNALRRLPMPPRPPLPPRPAKVLPKQG